MKTAIEKRGGDHKVIFTHGVQTFTLNYVGTKKECQWYKDRLDECFKKYLTQQQPSREKVIEVFRQARNNLYNDMPSGDIHCFDLLKIIKKHIKRMDIIIAESELSEEAPFDKNDDRCNVCGFINCVCGIE